MIEVYDYLTAWLSTIVHIYDIYVMMYILYLSADRVSIHIQTYNIIIGIKRYARYYMCIYTSNESNITSIRGKMS